MAFRSTNVSDLRRVCKIIGVLSSFELGNALRVNDKYRIPKELWNAQSFTYECNVKYFQR